MLISDNICSYHIECACLARCGYLQIMYLGDHKYSLQYYCSYRNKRFKEIERFNGNVILNNADMEYFANQFNLSCFDKDRPSYLTPKSCSGDRYMIRLEPMVDGIDRKEKNSYSLLVYRVKLPKEVNFDFEKRLKKKKLVFDICMSYNQVEKLYNDMSNVITLNHLKEKERKNGRC